VWRFEQGRIGSRRSGFPSLVFKLLPIGFEVADLSQSTINENRELDARQTPDLDDAALRATVRTAEFRRELQHELNYTDFVRTALTRLNGRAVDLLFLLERREP
jgi:hypothetical protein